MDIPKTYDPKVVEDKWYRNWDAGRCFKGTPDASKKSFCIVIPPPNVTGILHMGHLLNNTLQDLLVRRARQEGKGALWIPGTDHAGIATQAKVEKELRKEGLSRRDLGREKFIERACEWRDKHGGIILKQLQKLGVSCDWSRTVHTLDSDYSHAVLTAFVKLHERGYIYRGRRMVNWCPVSLTALSDEEVIMKSQKGKLYQVRYEIVENPGTFISVCTTRPETIMGDAAIAVHPEDERYAHLVGKHCWRPLQREQIPIIADTAIMKDFGTGALKVTPAHDAVDFAIGQRHNLPVIDVFNPDGTLNSLAGQAFDGMERFEARKKATEVLREMGALIKEEDYENNVGFSERANVPIEPRLSDQWFLRYPKIEEAKRAVESGLIQFWPKRWEKTYLHWLNNIQDWCISRQLWWGHRIPVWYRKGSDHNDPQNIHVSVNGPTDPENWEQDEDVLDTWASSWLWPFATMGWPNESAMKEKGLFYFYPTSDLVTGPDIIFFWVARMIIAGLEFMGEPKERLTIEEIEKRIPFKNVYFTGIIRDNIGRKMSKSLGNSPDPLDLIEKYGADGLRLGLLLVAPQGQDILFSEERIEQGRNFCNKLWNACRFRQMSGPIENNSQEAILSRLQGKSFDAYDTDIINRLKECFSNYQKCLDRYEFNSAVQEIFSFFWSDFCDWYLEVSKHKTGENKALALAVQDLCIRQVLLMLHPITPFITEELWHLLGYGSEGEFIQNTALSAEFFEKLPLGNGQNIQKLRDLVSQGRSLKAQYNLAAKKDVTFLYNTSADNNAFLKEHSPLLQKMIGLAELKSVDAKQDLPAIVNELGTFYLLLSKGTDNPQEMARIEKELQQINKNIDSCQSKLQSEAFVSKAPPHILEGAKKQLQENLSKRAELLHILGR